MVSIIIPAFNRQNCISETLDSVLAQIYQNWECIIVDDGSSDDTEKIVQKYLHADKRFSFYKRPNSLLKGANSCRNLGFSKANGKYIKFLDSDDLITNDALAKQSEILDANTKIQLCLSYGQYFDKTPDNKKEMWSRSNEYADYLLGHITNKIRWAVSDTLWRKSFFESPPFMEGLMNSQEWLMHGQSLLKLDRDEIFNLKETFTLIRRGDFRMSSVRTSFYYKNQRKSRFQLLKDVLRVKPFSLFVFFNLIKQIIVFSYWIQKSKSS